MFKMKKKVYILAFIALIIGGGEAKALAPADYAEFFKIDLSEKLPPIEELREQFRPAPVYDRKFEYYWKIGPKFDRSFAQTIRKYGTRSKRLKWEGEDEFVEMIKDMPPETYEYIGPYLHTLPGIPEKILNMPGIKETKNKFPSRIAPQVADIEDIEMISPVFYFLLMPEFWPENHEGEELDIPPKLPEPVNKYHPKLLDSIAKKIKPADFMPGANIESPVESRLRTINPDENSPLSTPDIKAFVNTLKELREFGNDIYRQVRLIEAGRLLENYENAIGRGVGVPDLKDTVHPCARLVQKIRLSGMESDFKAIISEQGFDSSEWAYTCDKTIKAYRLLNMSQAEAQTLKLFRHNIYGDSLEAFDYKYGPMIASVMQAMIERYNSPLGDMLEVKKNYKEIEEALQSSKMRIVGQGIFMK